MTAVLAGTSRCGWERFPPFLPVRKYSPPSRRRGVKGLLTVRRNVVAYACRLSRRRSASWPSLDTPQPVTRVSATKVLPRRQWPRWAAEISANRVPQFPQLLRRFAGGAVTRARCKSDVHHKMRNPAIHPTVLCATNLSLTKKACVPDHVKTRSGFFCSFSLWGLLLRRRRRRGGGRRGRLGRARRNRREAQLVGR